MKKVLTVLLILVMVFAMVSCGNDPQEELNEFDKIADTCESADGTYEIAMVTDVGNLKDGSFNQFTWNGCKKYASDNGKTYKYYQPANGSEATDQDRIDAMEAAIAAGAKVIVTPGFLQATALGTVAPNHPEVEFIFIDGWDMGLANVVGVYYQEEQAGYLAGYAVVMEGFTKLGFSGGGGGTNPACERYGYGFAQGANAAAKELGKTVELNYSWLHGATFSGSDDLHTMISGWFANGTEICFMCGGTMFNSGVAAASENNGKIVGVDVDQSVGYEGIVVTSATKGLAVSVETALAKLYADGVYGGELKLGAKENAVGIPTDTWSLKNWAVADYEALFAKLVSGEVSVDATAVADPTNMLSNVTVNYIG